MKSRRVGSAEDIVVTVSKPLSVDSLRPQRSLRRLRRPACMRTAGAPPQGATRRRRANRPLSTLGKGPNGAIRRRLLAPLPGERKSALATMAESHIYHRPALEIPAMAGRGTSPPRASDNAAEHRD